MSYLDLLSTIQMNLNLIDTLRNTVSVCVQSVGLKTFRLTDSVHPNTEWVAYQLGKKMVKVKVHFVQTPIPYEPFIFGKLDNSKETGSGNRFRKA